MAKVALIPAAGAGARFGAKIPKQYLDLLGKPLLAHTIDVFCRCSMIDRVAVVLSEHDEWWGGYDWSNYGQKLVPLFCGGLTRAESVLNGLRVLSPTLKGDDWILVHDAARPCLSANVLTTLCQELENDEVGGLLAVPVADTLKSATPNGYVENTVPRDRLWMAQTPQMFRLSILFDALTQNRQVTDESSAVEAMGHTPRLIPSALSNFKVTYPSDLELAAAILEGYSQSHA